MRPTLYVMSLNEPGKESILLLEYTKSTFHLYLIVNCKIHFLHPGKFTCRENLFNKRLYTVCHVQVHS
jgi:hypothetical protein